jgi:hypothetical protein
MKKTLNLYHKSCQPEQIYFSFHHFLVLFLVCLLFASTTFSLVVDNTKKNAFEKESARNELLVLQDRLASLTALEKENKSLQEKVEVKNELLEELRATQLLLTNLNQIELGEMVSFPELMYGLAKVNMAQINLLRFSFIHEKLNVEGTATESRYVPLWLNQVYATPELKAVSFDTIKVTAQKGGFLFQVKNTATTVKGKE